MGKRRNAKKRAKTPVTVMAAPEHTQLADPDRRTRSSPLARSSSLGYIAVMDEDRVSAESNAGGALPDLGQDKLADSVLRVDPKTNDNGVATNGKVTPPTIPALDVARAVESQQTAPPLVQQTARDRGWEQEERTRPAVVGGGFLSGRQRNPAVYDSARSNGNLSDRRGEAHGQMRNQLLQETPRSPAVREEMEVSMDSVESFGSTGFKKNHRAKERENAVASNSTISLSGYLAGELIPEPVYHTVDAFWGQTERDRVYNALWYVPYQLERLIGFGIAICLHAFLGIFTILPLRVARSLLVIARACLSNMGFGRRPKSPVRVPKKTLLRGDQIYDLICASIFVVMTVFLWHIRAGAIYFWVKELTQEFLKLSVLHTALELGDKICCSFGVDVLEALAASCTTLSVNPTARNIRHVLSDAMVALMLMVAHAGALMCQALVYGVAMNSKKNSLLALLIASNFTEIKGTVFKRYDPTKIFTLTCQDIVERFHLYVIMSFVLVEESVGSGQPLPSPRLVMQCLYVLFAEVVIDVTKHAVLGKFNDIRPGVYAEFTKDLCENLEGTQSHTVHKLVGIEPFASAALFFRVFVSFVALQRDLFLEGRTILFGIICAAVWLVLVGVALMFGYLMRSAAGAYLRKYTETSHSRRSKRAVSNKKTS